MSPESLKEYLAVFREAKVSQARIVLDRVSLEFAFQPEIPAELAAFGTAPEPGGWKTPSHLDNVMGVEEPK